MPSNSIVFVDSRVANYRSLIGSLTEPYEVFVLDGDKDGVDQMAGYLKGRSALDAIHVISHGSQGALYLGGTVLNSSNLVRYEAQLGSVGSSLTQSGDILLYGCNVAQGDVGLQFVQSLAQATGADVAASDNATGAEALDGDWVLEEAAGRLETTELSGIASSYLFAANTAPTFFVSNGRVTTDFGSDDRAYNLTVQPDGKIVVFGSSAEGLAWARYNFNGSLDTSFGINGKVTTDKQGVRITHHEDSIFVANTVYFGSYNFVVTSLKLDGSLDISFGESGRTSVDFGYHDYIYGVSTQIDRKVIAFGRSGTDFAVVRINSDGIIDTSFDLDGMITTDFGSEDEAVSVVSQLDGKLLVAGTSGNKFALARYNNNGSLDSSFSDDGKVIVEILSNRWNTVATVKIQADGKILIAGTSSSDFSLVRLNSDGSLDNTFGENGAVAIDILKYSSDTAKSIVLQGDGKILVAGETYRSPDYNINYYDFALMRFNADGSLDTSFNNDGIVTTNFDNQSSDFGESVSLQSDGKILVAGWSNGDFALVRYNSDGWLDSTFSVPEDSLQQFGPALFVENTTPVILAFEAQILDAELSTGGQYSGATLTLQRHGEPSPQDVFSSAGGTLTILNPGSYFSVDSVTIGRVTTNIAGTLTLTFNTNATQTLVNKAMQQIAYANTSDAPPGSVVIDWTFSDGNTGAQGTGGALSVTGSTMVNITAVNDAPYVAVSIPNLTIQADTAFSYTMPAGTFLDPDGDSLAITLAVADGTGVPPWLNYSSATKTLSGTPGAQDAGTLSLLVNATDPSGAVVSTYVNLTVVVNSPPTLRISTIPAATYETEYNDDRAYATQFTTSAAGHLSNSNDVDWFGVSLYAPGMQTVTVDSSSMSSGIFNVYWYDPSMQVMSGRNIGPSSGSPTFTYEFLAQSSGTYYLRVQTTNPIFYNGGTYNVYLSAPDQLTYTDTAADDTFANKTGTLIGTDIDSGTTLSYGISTGLDNGTTVSKVGTYGTLNLTKATGAFVFTPNDAAIEALKGNATQTFYLTVSDGIATTQALYSLTLTGADDTTAFGGVSTGTAQEDATVSANGTLTAADRDTGDATITAQSNTAGTYGKFSISGDGAWTYSLNNSAANVQALKMGQSVTDSFTVITAGGATQAIIMMVGGANDTPVASGASVSSNEDTAIAGSLFAGDADADSLTYSLVSQATQGSVNVNPNGTYTYTPTANYSGPDSFTFKANDGALNSNTATVSITVTPVNDAPLAAASSRTATEDTPLSGSVTATDIEASPLTYSAVTQPAHGTLTLNPNGTYTYTPTANYNGPDSFTFKANDGALDSNTATVSITVNAVNDAPVLVTPIPAQSATTGTAFSYVVPAATFTDVDSPTLTYSAAAGDGTALPAWLSFNATTRTLSGTAGAADAGALTVRIVAADASLSASTAFVLTTTAVASTGLDGTVQDGYVSGAAIYIDRNGNNRPDADENTGLVTDSQGRFAGVVSGAGSLIAVGGINTDTGLPNRLNLSAPSGASVINPITTLIETLVDQQGVTPSAAAAIARTALGVSNSIDLLAYDPLAPGNTGPEALGVQKAMVQLALVATLAGDGAAAMAGVSALAAGATGALDLRSTATLNQALAALTPAAETVAAIALANTNVQQSTSPAQITAAQLQASDAIAPVVSGNVPANGASAVTIAINLVLSFSEPIARGSGSIVLKTAAGAIVATYDAATSPQLTVSGSTLTIDPAADLGYSTGYVLELSAGSIRDIAGNAFAGAVGSAAYAFSTQAAPNRAPVAASISVSLNEDTTLSASLPTATDADGDTITYARTAAPSHGTVTVNAGGGYSYVPTANYFGSDSFGYSVSDGRGASSAYTVSITVNGVTDTLNGTAGVDVLTDLTGGPSVINGLDGNDTITGGSGDDTLNGGTGLDVALYGSARAVNSFVRLGNGDVQISGPDGVDTLHEVERAVFGSAAVGFDIDGTGGKAYRLYQAAFDRVPDEGGVGFWMYYIDRGFDIGLVAAGFITSPEFTSLYGPSITNDQFIQLLYQNVLNRDPDAEGYAFWRSAMANEGGNYGKAWTRSDVLVLYSDSAENKANVIGVITDGFQYEVFAPPV
jgi:uncharacterized delta-60 repeat protein